jgi:putative nucleotidyltransferase with HDIG domain
MIETDKAERILIVDDEESVRNVLYRTLSPVYPNCGTSHSAFDALNKIKNDQYSLVISDVMMPGMSGVELLRFVKKHDADIAVMMITGVMDINTAVDCMQIGAYDFISKPFELGAIHRAVERALERRRLLLENRFYERELERKVRERTIELNLALRDVDRSYKITLEALVTALDAREHETQAHSLRVREYTLALGQTLGLESDDLVQLGRGALLHDVGKIGVPDSILLKPGRLTEAEWVDMRKHPRVGYEILESIQFLSNAAEIVYTHQERWDGQGYPLGLAGNSIPLGARIFAVADTLDAITSDRPYRKAGPFETAWEEVRRCSGTQFDPKVVEAFLSVSPAGWRALHDQVNRSHSPAQVPDE